ncbi:MAG: sigma-70 family RNA polymerase sigma factor [Clostridiales bacterium]|nr:sigma-70 family RNA polymerase sigma factor [Clostridiales bacterium]
MTDAETVALCSRIQNGDQEALNEFTERNLGLIVKFLDNYKNEPVEAEDAFMMGYEGLRAAALKFDPSLGYKFSTYAKSWICRAIERGINKEAYDIYIPERAKADMIKNKEDVSFQSASSLDAPLRASDGDMTDLTLGDTIASDRPDPIEVSEREMACEALLDAVSKLPIKEAMAITLLYGLFDIDRQSLSEAGKYMGLSKEGVRQNKLKGFSKLEKDSVLEGYSLLYM